MVDIKEILKNHAYQNIPLWYDMAYGLGAMAVASCDDEVTHERERIQTIAALSALHNKATYAFEGDGVHSPKNAAEQIAGICAAIFREDIQKSEFGFITPDVPYVMDNCGMGGDLIVTANVSTIAALIAAAAGIPMCKHGSPSNADKGRHGSSDFVQLCGINPYISKSNVEASVKQFSFGYTEALDTRFKRIHRQTHEYAYLPHMNDIIGPITNPIDPSLMSRRVIGVNHLVSPTVVAQAYQIMNHHHVTNMQHLIVVRGYASKTGYQGMDELSICAGGTDVAELHDGELRSYRLTAADFGLEEVDLHDISPPEGMSKGDFSLKILDGEIAGAPLQMILANAALLFKLHDDSLSLKAAYEAAADTFATGSVPGVVENVRSLLPKAA